MFKPSALVNLILEQRRLVYRYLTVVSALNLVWEVLQLPLYTIWRNSSNLEIAFAVVHCTAGDVFIAFVSLVAALLLAGNAEWPKGRYKAVAVTSVFLGIGYTVFSEWNNTVVTRSWSYSTLMPEMWGIGLSPLAQWIVIPCTVYWSLFKNLGD